MNVLILTPFINLKKGPYIWANNLSMELMKKNIDVNILTINDEHEEIPTTVHKGLNIEKKILKYPFLSITNKIIDITKKNDIQLIHASNLIIGGLGAVLANKITGIPVILTLHGLYFDEVDEWCKTYFKSFGKFRRPFIKISSLLLSKIGMYVLKRCNLITVPSNYLKSYLESLKISSIVVPNGINIELSQNIQKYSLNPENRIILSIMHMDIFNKAKGLKILFDAIKVLKEEFKIELWVVGTGKYMEKLENYCIEEKIPVKFLGYRKDVPQLFEIASIYVHSSLQDNFPISILESMAYKKPIVAIGVGGIPEMVRDGFNGFISSPDSSELAEKIKILLENKNIAENFVNNSYKEIIEKYSWDKVADSYINIYNEFIY